MVYLSNNFYTQVYNSYAIIESGGRGPCDLARKPAKIGIVTKNFKYIRYDKMETTKELYNLNEDKNELNNLIKNKNYSNIKDECELKVKKRILTINNKNNMLFK